MSREKEIFSHSLIGPPRGIRMVAIRLMMLKMIQDGDMYPYVIFKRARRTRLLVGKSETEVKNDVYNALNALEALGYVGFKTKLDGNRAKKYYYLTRSGKVALKTAKNVLSAALKDMISILR